VKKPTATKMQQWVWWEDYVSTLVALHPDSGARAPGPAPWIRISGREARPTQRVRAARAVAVVATPLSTIFPDFPDGPYDQEIKSLLLYQLRTSPECRILNA
jgi:hypothetical protein